MFIEFVKEKRYKTTNNLDIYKTIGAYCCEVCKKRYESSVFYRKKALARYGKDLCISCKQISQYKDGLREVQREKCKALGLSQKGKTCEKIFGKEKAKEIKKKLSDRFSGKGNPMYGKHNQMKGLKKYINEVKGKHYEDIYGERKSKEIKEKISHHSKGKNNPMYGKPAPNGSGNGWSGWYKEIYFRSLLELNYLVSLDKLNIKYKSAESNEFKVTYIDHSGKEKNYFPDFYLEETNQVIEIKPFKLIDSMINKLKFEAARKKFDNFLVLTEKDISRLSKKEIIYLINDKKVTLLNKYKLKLKEYINEEES